MDKLLTYAGKSEKGVFTYVIDEERNYLEKTASEYHPTVASYINSAKKIPGVTQLLLTALGAGEYWGSNVNSDFFGESELAHEGSDYGYQTFRQYAKVYKHHCFVRDTKVICAEGLRPIQDVVPGDNVLTHKGRYQPVLDVFRRTVDGNFITLDIQGLGEAIECTEEHTFLVVLKEDLLCPRHPGGKNFCTFYRNLEENSCRLCGNEKKVLLPVWVKAKDIRPGDYITQSLDKSILEKREGSEPLGTLCGFYLADGCFAKHNGKKTGIQITFSKDRLEVHNKLINACKQLNLSVNGPYIHSENNTALFVIPGTDMAEYIYENCGEYSDSKKISRGLVEKLGDAGCLNLLGAYIDGYGSLPLNADSRNAGVVRIRSCCISLLHTVRLLFLNLGIPASFNLDIKIPTISKTVVSKLPSGVVSIPKSVAKQLGAISLRCRDLAEECVKNGSGAFHYDDLILHRVRSVIVDEREQEEVFNLEVDEDNSYQVWGLNTHNCNKNPNDNYGDILLSVYNPIYHRVELIVGVNEHTGGDIIKGIESGSYPFWSMGCKIPYDICSICGNKAPNRKHYCEHLKYMLGRIDPGTGRMVYAINIKPRFFDISYVLIPADKTAMTLKKVASSLISLPQGILDIHGNIISSAEQAEKVASYKDAAIAKLSEMEKEIPLEAPSSTDLLESVRARILGRTIIETKDRERMLPNHIINRMCEVASVPEILSTLAACMIMPKPQEFQRIILISRGHSEDADKLSRLNACFNPSSYNGPITPELEEAVGLSDENVRSDLAEMLQPYFNDRSYTAPLLVKRMSSMVKQAEQDLPKPVYIDKDPNDESALLKSLGIGAALYTAFNMAASKSPSMLLELIKKHPLMATALGVGLYSTMNSRAPDTIPFRGRFSGTEAVISDSSDIYDRIERMRERPYIKVAGAVDQASRNSAMLRRLLIGVPAVQMVSGALQSHRGSHPGEEEGRISGLIRKHPNLVSGVLVADALLARHGKGSYPLTHSMHEVQSKWLKGEPLMKSAGIVASEEVYPGVKSASVQDYLSSSVIWPLAVGGGNLPGRIVGSLFDQAALDMGQKLIEKSNQRKATNGLRKF
jgi:hypothetical protein